MSHQTDARTQTADVPMDSRSFGGTDHYYAVTQTESLQSARESPSPLERHFEEFLKYHERGLKGRVERTFKQWNNILRDHLRSETGLRLTVGEETQAVPVRISDGLPEAFAEIIAGLDGRDWSMLLNSHILQQGLLATKFFEDGFEWISEWSDVEPSATEYEEIRHVRISIYLLLRKLRRLGFVERIRAVQEDILGAYFFRIPEVRLYWMVIGFLSGLLGVSVEALTVVVAAHELARAYTHLGRDIDGTRWETESFAATNLAITEGLAQFYAQAVCKKLEMRFPSALGAYERLLKLQSGPYLVQEEWMVDGEAVGEIVRISLVECRTNGIAKLGLFELIRRHHDARLRRVQRQDAQTSEESVARQMKAVTGIKPDLEKAVLDTLLWVGNYYYAGGVKDRKKWGKLIQDEIGPEITTGHLDYAWNQICNQSRTSPQG